MITFKKKFSEFGECWSVFDADQFSGYVMKCSDQELVFYPYPETSLRGKSFKSWDDMKEYVMYRYY